MESRKHYTGLTGKQVLESREKHGANVLTPPKRDSLWQIFIGNFEDPVIRILMVAVFLSGGIAISMYFSEGVIEIAETIGIAVAILLATGVATWFVWDANKKFDVLADDTLVKVIRDGDVHEVPKKEIVVDDIVLLEQGEEIPADGVLLEAISLQVNESSLTGEPMANKTVVESEFNLEATYPSNHVMRGTTVSDGHGIMRVLAVGDATEFGRVAEKSSEKSEEPTPLDKQLDSLAKFIGVVGFCGAAATFTILFIKAIFKVVVHHHFVRRLHALGIAVDVLHGEPFRFFRQGGVEFPHFGDLLPHVPGPQVLFRPTASAKEIFTVSF